MLLHKAGNLSSDTPRNQGKSEIKNPNNKQVERPLSAFPKLVNIVVRSFCLFIGDYCAIWPTYFPKVIQ